MFSTFTISLTISFPVPLGAFASLRETFSVDCTQRRQDAKIISGEPFIPISPSEAEIASSPFVNGLE